MCNLLGYFYSRTFFSVYWVRPWRWTALHRSSPGCPPVPHNAKPQSDPWASHSARQNRPAKHLGLPAVPSGREAEIICRGNQGRWGRGGRGGVLSAAGGRAWWRAPPLSQTHCCFENYEEWQRKWAFWIHWGMHTWCKCWVFTVQMFRF